MVHFQNGKLGFYLRAILLPSLLQLVIFWRFWSHRSTFAIPRVLHIRQLAQDLPHFLMLDLAPNTLKKYYGSFSKWQTWALSKGCSPIPASISYFLAFLVTQINICNSKSTFHGIIAGVSWAHKKMGFPSPADHTLVKKLISSVHNMLESLAVNRKLPLLQSHL